MSSDSTDNLQFTTPEPIGSPTLASRAAVQRCAGCGNAITSTYFAVRDKPVCPQCVEKFNVAPPGLALIRFLKAALFGLGAGILGALIWFAVRRIAHAEIGLVAVVVGFLVGKAVRKGSGGRGGLAFQIMAVILTYCCICANYVPDVIEGLISSAHDHRTQNDSTPTRNNGWKSSSSHNVTPANDSDEPSASRPSVIAKTFAIILVLVIAFGIALAAPVLAGTNNAIGLLIIGFALWEAWKFNRPSRLAITGPYQLGSSGPTGVVV